MTIESKQKVENMLLSWVEECIELRHGSAGDEHGALRIVSIEDGISEVAFELMRVRKRSDRVDFLRTQTSVLRSKMRKSKAEKDFQAEAKFMASMSERDKNKRDYESAIATKSHATLDSFEEKRAAHEANMLVESINDTYYIIDGISRQLDVIRTDLRAIIKALQFESSLEH